MKPVIGITNTNRAELLPYYVESVSRAGGSPVILPVLEETESLIPVLQKLDGIIFSGGTDVNPAHYQESPKFGLGEIKPYRDVHEMKLLDICFDLLDIPILGICRGHQLLNIHGGGTCWQDLERQRPEGLQHFLFGIYPFEYPSHEVRILEGTRIHAMLNTERETVNSFHHQGIQTLAPGYTASAFAPDGLIEAVEREGDRFVVGVQWHPEMMSRTNAPAQEIFNCFIQMC